MIAPSGCTPSTCGSRAGTGPHSPSADLASSSRHVRSASEPARRRGVLRPGQDDHRGIERARLQPALPSAGADHPPGGAAQRLRPTADHAVRRGRRDGGSPAAADHRAVHRLGGRSDPRHRGRDAARDRRAARLRRGHRAHRRAPGGRRRGRGALGVGARGRRADRRARRRRPLPGHPHGRSATGATPGRSSSISTASGRRRPPATSPLRGGTAWRTAGRTPTRSPTSRCSRRSGIPTAVNPDRALRRVAEERGWPILTFAVPVALRPRIRPATAAAVAGAGLGAAALVGAGWYGLRREPPLSRGAISSRCVTSLS